MYGVYVVYVVYVIEISGPRAGFDGGLANTLRRTAVVGAIWFSGCGRRYQGDDEMNKAISQADLSLFFELPIAGIPLDDEVVRTLRCLRR